MDFQWKLRNIPFHGDECRDWEFEIDYHFIMWFPTSQELTRLSGTGEGQTINSSVWEDWEI